MKYHGDLVWIAIVNLCYKNNTLLFIGVVVKYYLGL